VFKDPAVAHAHDVDVLQCDRLPYRRNPAEFAGVRPAEGLFVTTRSHSPIISSMVNSESGYASPNVLSHILPPLLSAGTPGGALRLTNLGSISSS
jgi:hypothetical protein